MRKRFSFLGIATLLVLLLTLLTGTALAADGEIAGADFNNGAMHWSISEDHILTISGNGEMPNYSEDANAPWYAYRGQIERIVVEDGITALGDYAFYDCSKAVSVELPDGIPAIPYYCFGNCSSLESIDIPDSVRTFGSDAFYCCRCLKTITLPEGLTELDGRSIFYGCNLESIVLPSTLKQVEADSINYHYIASLSDIYFNGTLKQWLGISFDDSGLMGKACNLYINGEKLTNLTIPEGITSIPDYAFQYVQLNSVTIPDGMTSIGGRAFYNSSVKTVRMADSVTSIGTNAFANCSDLKKVYYVGDSSKWSSIAWNSGNDSLIDAKLHFVASFDQIRTVSLGAVEHGTLTLSDSNCVPGDEITVTAKAEPGYQLKTIFVNGEEISGNSFIAKEGIDYVVSAEFEFYRTVKDHGSWGDNIEWVLYDNNELMLQGRGEMYCDYSSNYSWLKYRNTIESLTVGEGITTISQNAFKNCSHLSTVELPTSLKSIKYSVFNNVPLSTLRYNGSIEKWLTIEFNNTLCDSSDDLNLYIDGTLVSNLVIPEGITEIPAYSFWGYKNIKNVEIPEGVTVIGDSAFSGTSLNNIVLPASIETIGYSAFDCGLSYAEFKGNAPTISYSFGQTGDIDGTVLYYHQGTTGWTSPKWNGYYTSCLEINNYSDLDENNRNAQNILFTLNPTAKTAVVGDGSSHYNNAGYYGAQMGELVIPDTVTKDGVSYQVIGIGQYAFYRNPHITHVTIGTNVSSVIPTAFAECENLKDISVESGNTYFCSDDGVLYDIGKLYLYVYPAGKTDTAFVVPDTVKTIGQYAFSGNSSLNSIVVGTNVTSIYHYAFSGLPHLSEITLPFIGNNEKSGGYFSDVFDGNYIYPKMLKHVKILGGELSSGSFRNCSSIEELTLPTVPDEIPSQCFDGCSNLKKLTFAGVSASIQNGELMLPDGIAVIDASAFYGCKAITSVTLPATLTSLSSDAFDGSGLASFQVSAGNKTFSTDQWGVLYNADQTELIKYPAGRPWPYYNVLDTTTTIGDYAFYECDHLVNLYIPKQVTDMEWYAISSCPNLTVCCFMGSEAYDYTRDRGLTAWYMDNRTLQDIRVYHLPEQTIQSVDKLDWDGLYIVGNYDGKELQIDNYTLSYDNTVSGNKTVTVNYGGKTASFEMVLYTDGRGDIIAFDDVSAQDGQSVYIAVYDENGAMLTAKTAIVASGKASIQVKPEIAQKVERVKLFVMESGTYTPVGEVHVQDQ